MKTHTQTHVLTVLSWARVPARVSPSLSHTHTHKRTGFDRGPGMDPLLTGGSGVPQGSITNQIALREREREQLARSPSWASALSHSVCVCVVCVCVCVCVCVWREEEDGGPDDTGDSQHTAAEIRSFTWSGGRNIQGFDCKMRPLMWPKVCGHPHVIIEHLITKPWVFICCHNSLHSSLRESVALDEVEGQAS